MEEITKKCLWCEKDFILSRLGQKYCSTRCRVKMCRKKKNLLLKEHIGSKCIICNSENHICFHEIHGQPHNRTDCYAYLGHEKDFIPLCYLHHRLVHELAKLNQQKVKHIMELVEKIKSSI